MQKLTADEINRRLAALERWTLQDGKLHCELRFDNFVQAFGFMASAALIAESLGHHPEWFNVYNRVVIDLMTHDVGGLSAADFEFATRVEQLLAK